MIGEATPREAIALVLERWRWRAARKLAGLGLPGVIGVVLLLAAAWVLVIDVPEVTSQVNQVRQAQSAPTTVPLGGNATSTEAVTITGGSSRLPNAGAASRLPGLLLTSLRSAGVAVNEITVADASSVATQGQARTRHVDLSVSAAGSYAAIRRGLDTLLHEHPSLAMTYLSLSNDAPRSAARVTLQAQIRLRYFFASTP